MSLRSKTKRIEELEEELARSQIKTSARSKTKRIEELEDSLKRNRVKTKKLIDEIGDFQQDLGKGLIGYQRIMLVIGSIILFFLGLGIIIYAASHPDMDNASETRSNMYVAGGILMGVAVIMYFAGRAWLSAVEKNPSLQKVNATLFEINMAKEIFH